MRYFPDRGGSETYVSSLIRGLQRRGVENFVASAGESIDQHEHEGVQVFRLGSVDTTGNSVDYSTRLKSLVEELQPDVLHFHWQPSTIVSLLVSGWQPKCAFVLTFHHPAITCIRGDLFRFGITPCAGTFSRDFCSACTAHMHGASRFMASALTLVPTRLSSNLGRLLPAGRVRTALMLSEAIHAHAEGTHAFLNACQRIFVLAEWTHGMLLANNLPAAKLQLTRLGTHHTCLESAEKKAPKCPGETLRGIFVGRLDPVKGVHMLAQAMASIPDLPVEVDVFGPLEDADSRLAPFIEDGQKPDAKLRFYGILRAADVVSTMTGYDFAVVCSQYFETGPYTVIEAFQAGLPVLGTDIGGINEMVRHDYNGWLVPCGSVSGWEAALRMIVANPRMLDRWRQEVEWHRTMDDVAGEVNDTYQAIVTEQRGKRVSI